MPPDNVIARVRAAHDQLAAALAAAGLATRAGKEEFSDLAWDTAMQGRAEQARYNGGTAAAPRSRHGITRWSEGTGQTRWDFDRMRFIALTPLAAAWRHTGEPDYALAARDYIEGWLQSHPRPQDDDRLNTAIRINLHGPQGWLGTLPYFLDSRAFDEPFVTRLIETARRDLEWMRAAPAHTANVRLFQADALLWAGLRLPFVPEAATWRQWGVRMLNDASHRMIAPDGSNVERDPHYVGVYTAIYGAAPRWATAFPELGLQVTVEPVARLFDYAACGTKPNGYEVGLHDSVSAWEGRRDNAALAARADFRRAHGLPAMPPPTAAFFPHAGQAFLRTGWDEDAVMLTFDATREASAHNHLGANSLQVHAYGRTLLPDPGFLTYHMGHAGGTARDNLAGPYGKSTRAHNTLNLNGWNQFMISPEWARHWHTDGLDVVAARYNGGYWPGRYGWWFFEGAGHGLAATHERLVVWLHDRAAVVVDFLMRWDETTHGDAPHQHPAVEANWQFCPGPVTVDPTARRVHTGHADANVLLLFPVVPAGTVLSLHEGEETPFRGWVGNPTRDHSYLPAPQLALTAAPMPDYYGHFVTVIVPYRGTTVPTVAATATPTAGPGATQPGHCQLRWADGSTDELWWMHALGGAIMQQGETQTDAALLHLRHDAAGHFLRGAAVGGTYCAPFAHAPQDRPGAFPLIAPATEARHA